MNYKKEWDDKLYKEYQECSWDSVKELCKQAHKLALEDTEYKREYTHLVLFNLQMLANTSLDKITFKQWKSFRAYVNKNYNKEVDIKNLYE